MMFYFEVDLLKYYKNHPLSQVLKSELQLKKTEISN